MSPHRPIPPSSPALPGTYCRHHTVVHRGLSAVRTRRRRSATPRLPRSCRSASASARPARRCRRSRTGSSSSTRCTSTRCSSSSPRLAPARRRSCRSTSLKRASARPVRCRTCLGCTVLGNLGNLLFRPVHGGLELSSAAIHIREFHIIQFAWGRLRWLLCCTVSEHVVKSRPPRRAEFFCALFGAA